MKNFRKVLVMSALLAWFAADNAVSQENTATPVIRFGLIADIQYGDVDTNGDRHYRKSLEKLDACVTYLNEEHVDFTINLGDVTDRDPDDIKPVLTRLDKLEGKVYNTTGNHDYNGIVNNKILYRRLKMPGEYYSFKKNNWRFIMLNTNEIASYANVKDTWKEKELNDMLDWIKGTERTNAHKWNGGISSKQMAWLNKQLQDAQKRGENVLVFTHHPLFPASPFTALNDQQILDTITAYSCVKAVFSGHHHSGAFAFYKDIPCITTEGMVETEVTAFGVVDIYENELVVTGRGRTRSYKVSF